MIINVVGNPGSGKSFYSNKLLNTNKIRLIDSNSKYTIMTVKSLNITLLKVFFLFFAIGGISRKTIFQLKCFYKNVSKYSIIYFNKEYLYEDVVIDEGLLEPFNALMINQEACNYKRFIDAYIKIILKNKCLQIFLYNSTFIYLNCKSELCLKRIISRKQNMPYIFEDMNSSDIIKKLDIMSLLFEFEMNSIKKITNIYVESGEINEFINFE